MPSMPPFVLESVLSPWALCSWRFNRTSAVAVGSESPCRPPTMTNEGENSRPPVSAGDTTPPPQYRRQHPASTHPSSPHKRTHTQWGTTSMTWSIVSTLVSDGERNADAPIDGGNDPALCVRSNDRVLLVRDASLLSIVLMDTFLL